MSPVQQKPIMHGRDHMAGGADPIPGLVTGDFESRVLDLGPVGYWPMDDASGLAHDASGNDRPLSPVGSPLYGEPGVFTDSTQTSIKVTGTGHGGVPTDDSFVGDYPALNVDGGEITVMFFIYPTAYPPITGGITFFGSGVTDGAAHLAQLRPDGQVFWSVAGDLQAESGASASLETWTYVACTRDGSDLKIYFNAALQATAAAEPIIDVETGFFRVGVMLTATNTARYYNGRVAHVALFDQALSASEIAGIYNGGQGGSPVEPPGSGWVFPPAPVEDPTIGTPPSGWSGGTDPEGYFYEAHTETVVLYDAAPGRFDVPPRKWTRVPFNTVRIWRQWQPDPASEDFKAVFLPDDRGLSAAAANGILQLPDAAYEVGDPTPEQHISAWCNPEYPILDPDRLPNYTAPPYSGAPDLYERAQRIRNLTTGNVLRDYDFEDGFWRVFFHWPFYSPASGEEGPLYARNDNPFPRYPPWPGRPLHKNLPYPELPGGITEWLDWYQQSDTGEPGWTGLGAFHYWEPGTKFATEVWQDTPYLLRFTTNIYPHQVDPFVMPPDWPPEWPDWIGGRPYMSRPYLSISYNYDPATIDHATGLLL